MSSSTEEFLVPEEAFETGAPEGMLGVEEELWLAHPESMKLAGGAQKILSGSPAGRFSGELIDCEIEVNSGVHREPASVVRDVADRRRELLGWAERLSRVLGTSGTHPIGEWREQEIIDTPHYRRLEERLGWIIRRNNTFALHVHYAVQEKEKAVYLFNRLREYVPHMLALSVNSPFWQGEYTDMLSSRTFVFSRSLHRAGLPEPLRSWDDYLKYVDYLQRSGTILKLGEIWWDIRPHPVLSTIELRAFDAQTELWRTEALIALGAALCDVLRGEYEAGELRPVRPNREIEENKWSAQRYGMEGVLVDHETHEGIPTRRALERFLEYLQPAGRDLSGVERILDEPAGAERQLEVWRETGSLVEVARDIARRTREFPPAGRP
ncbi:YbdK family carboxylate-amine ligase [Rubrobacter taiwanensis]|uniref:Putative glutamate--cysteine ligase 2 n=1 Tax=Rubrobacter taiwanensis TaxID=185139 RepID=A0A4V2NWH7_9ACTN|nr:YbdK family carboxylate-amine ligase [Rubrobacter taiwanensis]TCJ17372.1 YbdK family carboxylate-amine ligase [Rubrobacter taiwanensis]